MYHKFDSIIISDFSSENISALYEAGYVFTRVTKGSMDRIMSVRIRLDNFRLSSENRRVLRKNEDFVLRYSALPYTQYTWQIGKMAHDFYETKFGKGIMSVNKIRAMFTEIFGLNMNCVIVYDLSVMQGAGYCLSYSNDKLLHYCYPFYDLNLKMELGMAMMLKAITFAKESNKKYIYLGSLKRYKLQFQGLECFDGENWVSGDKVSLLLTT